MARPAKPNDRTTLYARKVVAGKIVAGELVRLACRRHLDDLETGARRGIWFDVEEAERRLEFCGFIKHYKGEFAGCTFEPELWECFVIGSVFGWKKKDGTRRFSIAYLSVARKNGKTFIAAVVGINGLVVDEEAGAEIYSAATKKDQARLSHRDATEMVKASPELKKAIGICRDNLHIEATASKFEPLSADSNTMDGLNVHMALIDELHAHKTGGVLGVMNTATGARRQPLIFITTTAGSSRGTVCWDQNEYSIKILKGRVKDDSHFAYIATMDKGDRWDTQKAWRKANPNLGISAKLDDLKRKCKKAKLLPSERNDFLRLHLNVWTQQDKRWLDMDHWMKCGQLIKKHELKDVMAYGGLDLSQKIDLSAFVLLFPIEDEVRVLPFFWMPEERATEDPWKQWAKEGFITLTPGNVVDFDFITRDIVKLREQYTFEEISFDPWTAHQTAINLGEDHGFTMIECRQGYKTLSEPSKELERLVVGHHFNHGGNPVLAYMADNVAIRQDENGNIRPVKDKSSGRIDGIVASIMALDRMIRHESEPSIYETRGML